MLKRSDIRSLAGSKTYERGIELYERGRIRQFDIETDMIDPDVENITAKVKGSGRNLYTVEIAYDTVMDDIESMLCTCPAFRSYDGICKHCAAVLLEYEDRQEPEQIIDSELDLFKELDEEADFLTRSEARKQETTTSFKVLIEKEIARKIYRRSVPICCRIFAVLRRYSMRPLILQIIQRRRRHSRFIWMRRREMKLSVKLPVCTEWNAIIRWRRPRISPGEIWCGKRKCSTA